MKNFKLGATSGSDSRKRGSAAHGGSRGGGSVSSSGLRTSVAKPTPSRSTSTRQSGKRRGASTSGGRDRRTNRPIHPATPLDEMAGLALVAIALGLGALAWHPEWMGALEPAGRWLHDQLGIGRFAMVAFLVLIGLEAFSPHQALGVPLLTVSLLILWSCIEVLADLVGTRGGLVGRTLGGSLAGAVGIPGAWIVAVTAVIIDLQWITRVSLRGPARLLGIPVRLLVRLLTWSWRALHSVAGSACEAWARSRAAHDDDSDDRWPVTRLPVDARGAERGDARRLKVVEPEGRASQSSRSRRTSEAAEPLYADPAYPEPSPADPAPTAKPGRSQAEPSSSRGRRSNDGADGPVFPEYVPAEARHESVAASSEDGPPTEVVAVVEAEEQPSRKRSTKSSRRAKFDPLPVETHQADESDEDDLFDPYEDDVEIPGYEEAPSATSHQYELDETRPHPVPAVARISQPDLPPWEDLPEEDEPAAPRATAESEDDDAAQPEESDAVKEMWDEEQHASPPAPVAPREPVEYHLPAMDLLEEVSAPSADSGSDYSRVIVETLNSFGVATRIVNVEKGPTVTRYELQPARGVKVSKITSLNNDIALALAAQSIRIEAPIPGKSAIGIEVPNAKVDAVRLREILESPAFSNARGLPLALGKDISGRAVVADLLRMPHLLIAGATGSGKSVCLNTVIVSLLYRSTPQEVQLVMVDPKRVELSIFEGIPHLANTNANPQSRIVKDAKSGTLVLKQATEIMNQRFELLSRARVRNIGEYNAKSPVPMPYLVIIVDELAQLMQISAKSVEGYLQELAQMGRAAGIHLILATQRPSVDVLTGTIKSNFPARIAFAVSAQVDSRTILDRGGAEKLLGRGDMLFSPTDAELRRVQGALITLEETERVVDYWRAQEGPTNLVPLSLEAKSPEDALGQGDGGEDEDLLREAVRIIRDTRLASASNLQRKLQIGYPRAARLVDELEHRGFLGPANGSKPRKILFLEE